MLSRLSFRSVRSLTVIAAAVALVAVLALPVQAAPRTETGVPPITGLFHWVLGLFTHPGFGEERAQEPAERPSQHDEDDGVDVVFMKEGCTVDPTGSTCPEND